MIDYFSIFVVVICIYFLILQRRQNTRTANNNMHRPFIINRRRPIRGRPIPPAFVTDDKTDDDNSNGAASPPSGFEPTPNDVIAAKQLLSRAGNLPLEIADVIIDQAEYWASSTSAVSYAGLRRPLCVRGNSPNDNQFVFRTNPLALDGWEPDDQQAFAQQAAPQQIRAEYPAERLLGLIQGPRPTLEHPCRKIVFDIDSHDQGWGGDAESHGTYTHSYTWFDVGLDRFEAGGEAYTEAEAASGSKNQESTTTATPITCDIRPIWPTVTSDEGDPPRARYHHELYSPPDHKLQANKVAVTTTQHHHIEWRWDDDIDPESPEATELENAGRGRATGNGEFVRNMKLGDMVTVWARARFPGWSNTIEKVEIKVYWSI